MTEIKIRYVFKRKEDGHIWMIIYDISGVEERSGQLHEMLYHNDLWELVSRDRYTGLEDKDGQHIYEGDIVQWKDATRDEPSAVCQIEFVTYLSGPGFRGPPSAFTDWRRDCEVIGNIYENPELLK